MFRLISTSFLWLLSVNFFALAAQPEVLGISDPEQVSLMLPEIAGLSRGNAREMITRQSVRSFMMPVRNNPDPAMDACYAATSALEFYCNIEDNYKINLSPDHLYLSLILEKRGQITSIFQVLAETGAVDAAIVPYGAKLMPPAVAATSGHTIQHFLLLFRPETRPQQQVFEIRKALMRGNPVLLEMHVDPGFDQIQQTAFWEPPVSDHEDWKLQTLVVVSFDEENKAFEVRHCRGRNWGTEGHLWVRYEDFMAHAQRGYVLLPQK